MAEVEERMFNHKDALEEQRMAAERAVEALEIRVQ